MIMNKQVKIGIAASILFLVVIISVIVYTVAIKKEKVDINEGLQNRIIVESLMLPQVFTPQQNVKTVSELVDKKTTKMSAEDAEKAAKRNAEIVNSLAQ
jgi:uncharacterized protein YqhQ